MQTVQTVSGREMKVTVGYRLPYPIYQTAVERARERGCKLSQVLREATARGLGVQAGDAQEVKDDGKDD